MTVPVRPIPPPTATVQVRPPPTYTGPVRPSRASRARRLLASGALRGLLAGLALAALIASCVVNRLVGPRLTGTCEGACSHYVACKSGEADRTRCLSECPDVFADRDSLMAFESLSCTNAVEYVDGSQRQVANPR